MADVKRRHRERLQKAVKRRSIATCSSKEVEGAALETILQNFLTNRTSRRRSGRPLSTQGSPAGGSLSEITSHLNLPTENTKVSDSFKEKNISRKDWNSAAELTHKSSENKMDSTDEVEKVRADDACGQEEIEETNTEESTGFKRPNKTSSPSRHVSVTNEDDKEDFQDNTKEEAEKLREASKKVLRFQNSRGSVSSGEYSLENQKSPGGRTLLSRQRTFDEEIDRYPEDQTNKDLLRFLIDPSPNSKHNLSRRHTMPSKVYKTEEEEDDLWDPAPIRTPNSVAKEKGAALAEGDEDKTSKQVFVFSEASHNIQPSADENHVSPSAEKKRNKSVETPGNPHHKSSETTAPRNTWNKTETTGFFFSFIKRLGDIGKSQSSKDGLQKHKGSDV